MFILYYYGIFFFLFESTLVLLSGLKTYFCLLCPCNGLTFGYFDIYWCVHNQFSCYVFVHFFVYCRLFKVYCLIADWTPCSIHLVKLINLLSGHHVAWLFFIAHLVQLLNLLSGHHFLLLICLILKLIHIELGLLRSYWICYC